MRMGAAGCKSRIGKGLALAACAMVLAGAGAASAQFTPPSPTGEIRVIVHPPGRVEAAPGETFSLPVELEIADGFHINSEKPTSEYLIPTRLAWDAGQFKLAGVEYPKAVKYTPEFDPDTTLEVFAGRITILSRFQALRGAAGKTVKLSGRLRYQSCDDKACYPPVNVPVEAEVHVRKHSGKPSSSSSSSSSK